LGTFFVHKTKPLIGSVFQLGDQWFWCTGSADSSGTVATRELAEQNVIAHLTRHKKQAVVSQA
jgi:hypothetical protein